MECVCVCERERERSFIQRVNRWSTAGQVLGFSMANPGQRELFHLAFHSRAPTPSSIPISRVFSVSLVTFCLCLRSHSAERRRRWWSDIRARGQRQRKTSRKKQRGDVDVCCVVWPSLGGIAPLVRTVTQFFRGGVRGPWKSIRHMSPYSLQCLALRFHSSGSWEPELPTGF